MLSPDSRGGPPPPPPPPPSPPPPPARAARLGLGDLLGRSVALYRAQPGTYMAIAVASALPTAVMTTLFTLSDAAEATPGRQLPALLILVAAMVFFAQFSAAGTAVAVIDALHGRRPDAGRAMGAVGDRMPAVLGVGVIGGLTVALGSALIIVGVYVAIVWTYGGIAAVVERRGAVAALRRSDALVKGAFWWTLAMIVGVTVVAGIALLGLAGFLGLIALGFDGDQAVVASGVAAFAAAIVVEPLRLIATALMYVHRYRVVSGGPVPPVPDGSPEG